MAHLHENIIHFSDERDVFFYAKYLSTHFANSKFDTLKKGNLFIELNDYENIKILKSKINSFICALPYSNEMINHLVSLRNANLISIDSFNWLERDKEACSFFWGVLKLDLIKKYSSYEGLGFPLINNDIIKYDPNNHKERLSNSIEYFDSVFIENPELNKIELMEKIKETWRVCSKDVKPFKWMNANSSECIQWCWSYLEAYDYDEHQATPFAKGINSLKYFRPTNNEEKFLAIYSVLKLWKCHHSEKKMLISNMSKAWRQRKLREERVGQKAINCYIDTEVKNRLDKLARQRRCQLSGFLTELINEEYERVNKN